MKFDLLTTRRNLLHALGRFAGKCASGQSAADELPLRSELFSSDQMQQYGITLANVHELSPHCLPDRLLGRLAENETVLIGVCSLLTEAIAANRLIAPAGEWLLDNFYLIEEQIRTAKRHLPQGYSRQLPRLVSGQSANLPRVYDIALETISHSDGRIDPESLSSFVTSYQTITPLKLGELWAIPIMLRLALIENLRRITARVAIDRINRNNADFWADQMIDMVAKDANNLILVISDMARSNPPLVSSFVAELARRLQGQGPALALPLTWIEQRLSETGLTIEQMVRAETQQQAADQLSVSNSIGSLRLLGVIDWPKFVDAMSFVELILSDDPADVYDRMDFATRDSYRHVIERVARKCSSSEIEIAQQAIVLAQQAAEEKGGDDREAHVGFYLIDTGLRRLERLSGVRLTPARIVAKGCRRFPLLVYGGTTLALTMIFTGGLISKAVADGLLPLPLFFIALLFLLSAGQLAQALANWLVTLLVAPRPLPRMDFSKGIPVELRTLVVVPTMLTGITNIENLIEALEVRFLANRDAHLHFGLLTDFADAETAKLDDDQPLLDLARQRVENLNEKYRTGENDIFFLFHRPRRFNPADKKWMGYERKRGKLADLNALLLSGVSGDDFQLVVGNIAALSGVKYVITLDTDTLLARDSAWRLVGAMAHPLNRPVYDQRLQRVVAGYGILQPRVAVSLSATRMSSYARLFGSDPGIDPYTRAISDVYQDLFGEGSFIGKGIYEVAAFEQALAGRFPDNLILSHDLLEGCYARAGLLSDVQLYEEYPARYSTDVNRRYRWIRGDWQIVRWLLPGVPGPDGRRRSNPLSMLSRWKILDNLRRSLTAAALTLLLLLGWTLLASAWFWTLAVIGIILVPALLASLLSTVQKADDVTLRQHLGAILESSGKHCLLGLFTIICLPYEAYFSLDAVLRTIWRMTISRRRLLEWNPSGDADRTDVRSHGASWQTMWFAPAMALSLSIGLAMVKPMSLFVAAPILLLWFFSPTITWWFGRPAVRQAKSLTTDQNLFLHQLSRRTWAFFETFVGPEDHWLPPDNFQEQPVGVVAHRTSPTNIGLALLANLSAYDFGYISCGKLLERTENTLHTMDTLERYRGHFYNWYDTQSLTPLPPLYVSSVDSGNLAGHLLTLGAGLHGLVHEPIVGRKLFAGLSTTFHILKGHAEDARRALVMPVLEGILTRVLAAPPVTLTATQEALRQLADGAGAMLLQVEAIDNALDSQLRWWASAFAGQCNDARDELMLFAPWTQLLSVPRGENDLAVLEDIPTLGQLVTLVERMTPIVAHQRTLENSTEKQLRLDALLELIRKAGHQAETRIKVIDRLAKMANAFAQMEYEFLFDSASRLLAIGYNVTERRQDASFYDLLASEARFAAFVAIAQGQLPQESWFALSRLLTTTGGEPILLSWSGSMFEYLMPLLVMPSYENTLLHQTCKAAVASQIAHGKKRDVPWGISESGFNAIDIHQNYQYRAFGVPGLGLKRGLAEDLVVAPYATALALMVAPEKACLNLQRLAAEGFSGRYGFYEAIDYTPSRLPSGQSKVVVRSFMAHHQGMSFLAIAHLLLGQPMQKRFEAEPLFQATMLLLQERIPKETAFYAHTTELSEQQLAVSTMETPIRVLTTPNTPYPKVQLLSNGRYHVMITAAGGGYSRWNDLAITRWREDGTCDNWGTFCYVRDVDSGRFWSTTYQPTRQNSKQFEAIFSEGRAEFRCRHDELDAYTEVVVSSEDDIELRRITLTNRSRRKRSIDVTSYAEVVLTSPIADALHPAFSNLFVQTEIAPDQRAILCTRRPRSENEQPPWMLHQMVLHDGKTVEVSYETDRLQFIGRGNSVANPQALHPSGDSSRALSGSQGSVLDPIVAIRYRINLDSEESVTIHMVTGIGATREAAITLVQKYQDRHLADRVFDMAWTHGQVLLRQINATEADAQLYGRLAAAAIYAGSSLRADAGILKKNTRGQSGLWGYAISGDLPIVLLQIADIANIDLVRQMVQAHAYWRLKGLAVDLVIWNEDHAGYRQLLHDQIIGLIAAGIEVITDRPGGIFVRPADQIAEEDRILFQAAARVIVSDSRGTLTEQINGRVFTEVSIPHLVPTRTLRPEPLALAPLPRHDLLFFNGLGGFTPDGREYVITTAEGHQTPAPWVNVLANPLFGTVISESGSAYTWTENAHEFRLTPWSNDSVCDTSGEVFYLRDEERGHFWSPTPRPSRGATPYVTRHGFGYSVFEHTERGIRSELWVYVALDAAVKFSVLKVRNESGRSRKLTATGYVEWVLGDLRPKSAMHVITAIDQKSGALFARNPYNTEFNGRTAFFDVDDRMRSVTCDRTEFIGRNGTLSAPAAMTRTRLSGRVGAAFDPCAAIQVSFDLAPGQEREIIFKLGVGRDRDNAEHLVNRFRGAGAARSALDRVWQHWTHTLGAINVQTPDLSLNVLANGWLLYQNLACRLWARTATYQSGGAFGFRDQLQDVMALIYARPHLVREHLLLSASRQFEEGDAQHWWHPPLGRGVRTHCSDDYLWLPLATCRYVLATGDRTVLDEQIHFLQGRPVNADEDSYYDLPIRSEEVANLYDHCVRAILHSFNFGTHGLPLIGSCDWNDGMNLVGEHGRGESVWLGFFLYEVLMRFAEVAGERGDIVFVERCQGEAALLRRNIENHGWDGLWYRRAYFDDGTPLGSSINAECRIDSIAQSWSVLSGAAHLERSQIAMDAVDEHLVRREHGLIQLLDPPFDKSDVNPGYIKGYVPGVRENGGQYTHAAIWATMAFARLGDNRRAWELFTMINPVNHSRSAAETALYKVEPYVVAADVYAVAPHTGCGGWTWYTGSAAWMYRLIIESLLGLQLEVDKLHFTPCLPDDWQEFTLHYRYRNSVYHITVQQLSGDHGATQVIIDGKDQDETFIVLVDDHKEHQAVVRISRR